ncbi:LPXTG cell wall anchor domain-containing protein [Lacisediminihabitans sp. FW035]
MPTAPLTLLRPAAIVVATGLAASALIFGVMVSESVPASAATSCRSSTALSDGGFEDPAIAPTSYQIMPSANVPGWESTDPSGIEIWSTGFNGVPASVGNQFAEINATQPGTLYQDVVTTPGQSLQWSLLHRGRSGADVMDVVIGATGGTLASQGELTDDTSGWGRHTGVYVVPVGQTSTRFGFRAVSTANGNPSVGNFLDDITFGLGPCIESTGGVTNVTVPGGGVHVGDTIEYTVTSTNSGGGAATLAALRDTLPAGVELVPGSIRVTGPNTGGKTDVAGDDQAEYDSATRTIVGRLGTGADAVTGGSLAPGQTTSLVFRVVVLSSGAFTSLSNTGVLSYTDSLAGTVQTSTAPTVVTPVAPTANLVVTATVDSAAPIAGGSNGPTYTVTVGNSGPQADSAVVVSIAVPAALSGASVLLAGAPCAIASGTAQCAIGSLAAGASAAITITGSIAGGVPSGTVAALSASATGAVYESSTADNSAGVSATTVSLGDLWVTTRASATSVREGDITGFAIEVGNTGPSDATAIVLAIDVPAGLDATPTAGSFDPATSRWTVPALASGATESISFRGAVTTLGRLSQRVTIFSSSVQDADAANDTASASLMVQRVAVLAPVSAVSADEVAAASPSAATGLASTATSATGLAHTGADAQGTLFTALALMLAGIALVVVRRRRARR